MPPDRPVNPRPNPSRRAFSVWEEGGDYFFFGGTHCTKISNDFWSLDPDSVSVPGFRGKRICEKGLQKGFIRRKFSGQRCIDPDPVLKESWIRIRFVLRGWIRVRIQTGSETLDKMRYLKIICICVTKEEKVLQFYIEIAIQIATQWLSKRDLEQWRSWGAKKTVGPYVSVPLAPIVPWTTSVLF